MYRLSPQDAESLKKYQEYCKNVMLTSQNSEGVITNHFERETDRLNQQRNISSEANKINIVKSESNAEQLADLIEFTND